MGRRRHDSLPHFVTLLMIRNEASNLVIGVNIMKHWSLVLNACPAGAGLFALGTAATVLSPTSTTLKTGIILALSALVGLMNRSERVMVPVRIRRERRRR